jgi:hypothetical protein
MPKDWWPDDMRAPRGGVLMARKSNGQKGDQFVTFDVLEPACH